jgi:GMP synthase (glutamine-hydrolysing)
LEFLSKKLEKNYLCTMNEKVLILDCGSQYTQLIARRVRELNIYSDIVPYNKIPEIATNIKAVILSGSPFSTQEKDALQIELSKLVGKVPVLGVCYGAQFIAQYYGGKVERSSKREYGKATLCDMKNDEFFAGINENSQIWMSHGDTILGLPEGFEVLASTENIPIAAFKSQENRFSAPVYAIQFHPEVTHSLEGAKMLENFLVKIAGCSCDYNSESFVRSTIQKLKIQIGNEKVLMALSGGVDSSVGAMLLHQAIGKNLVCFFVDNGLLRKNEYAEVLESYKGMGLNIFGVDAKKRFYDELAGHSDPETKRKIIGRVFIEVFEEESSKLEDIKWLGQGTIYPDVIESISVHGPSVTIKSHHNVGGLPDKLKLKIIEPLRMLFKDEVRKAGKVIGVPDHILKRHPFPGPGLGIRILGDITEEKVQILQEADAIYTTLMKKHTIYDDVWQAGAMLLPVQTVGVMGDERTYERTLALRAVTSIDGMTAEWARLPYDFLAEVSSEIINNVKGINRVVYDISTKPPATIEWE